MSLKWVQRKEAFNPDTEHLQHIVDGLFRGSSPANTVPFSLTLADPAQDGCPIVGFSSGFTKLTGYPANEILGTNCRFLIEPVPAELVNHEHRKLCRDYIDAVKHSKPFAIPAHLRESWMPSSLGLIRRIGTFWSGVDIHIDDGGLFCCQVNAKKSGRLFRNMFFLHHLELWGHPYIIGLQHEVADPLGPENLWGLLPANVSLFRNHPVHDEDRVALREACQILIDNVSQVEVALLQMLPSGTLRQAPLSSSMISNSSSSSSGKKECTALYPFGCCSRSASSTSSTMNARRPSNRPLLAGSDGGGLAGQSKVDKADESTMTETASWQGIRTKGTSVSMNPNMVLQAERLAAARRSQMRRQGCSGTAPSANLRACLEDVRTDWAAVKAIVENILSPDFTIEQYAKYVMQAFPELVCLLFDWKVVDRAGSDSIASSDSEGACDVQNSGRSGKDEFQRTMGAFFAIFWLLRLEIDGKDGFCFGVADNWTSIDQDMARAVDMPGFEKRAIFREKVRWDYFKSLSMDAGLLCTVDGEISVNKARLAALLCLTAFHDIMKIDSLLPKIASGEYSGYSEGDVIQDHDMALAYVMDVYPELLPSFKFLSQEQRNAIKFMQCKVAFNHGWFVQAEAPPGAVFKSFRSALKEAVARNTILDTKDLALYLMHWLTDLAGAEGTPLAGCEKFVVKFPVSVLMSFLRAFEYVEKLAVENETIVMEKYLMCRWKEHIPPPGPVPKGMSAIAKMRLLCMAQANAIAVLSAFEDLGVADREVLSQEMALTGCSGQNYSASITQAASFVSSGPAILVYYGPAMLQDFKGDHPVTRLSLLAEVYRRTRALWPAKPEDDDKSVIVRIDAIKALSVIGMRKLAVGKQWAVVYKSHCEATIELLDVNVSHAQFEFLRLPKA